MDSDRASMPALRFRWLTPWYDLLIRGLLPEREFKICLLQNAHLQPGEKVLDFGCGTGTLLQMAAAKQPACQLYGLDSDQQALQLAEKKLQQTQGMQLVHYDGRHLPFPDAYFDKIMCSLVFCNLTPAGKRSALQELHRVLTPTGALHVVEWGRPARLWVKPGFWLLQAVGGFKTTRDLAAGQLSDYLREANFGLAESPRLMNTGFGTLYRYACRKQETSRA